MTDKLSLSEFCFKAGEYFIAMQSEDSLGPQRMGQAIFNMLAEYRPDLSEQIRGTFLDPFYKNEVPKEFTEWLEEHWDDDH